MSTEMLKNVYERMIINEYHNHQNEIITNQQDVKNVGNKN